MDHYQSDHEEVLPVPRTLRMTAEVFDHIRSTIGIIPAESGGILGGNRETGEVTRFYYDWDADDQGHSHYTPNTEAINEVIKLQWRPQGIDFLGSIHSHSKGVTSPSAGDSIYARHILEALELPYLLTPIVIPSRDKDSFTLHAYAAVKAGDRVEFVDQELVVNQPEGDFERYHQQEEEELNEYELFRAAIEHIICATESISAALSCLSEAALEILSQSGSHTDTASNNNRSKDNG